MGGGALHDVVGYVSGVPATQRLRKNRALDRSPIIIIIRYALIDAQLALAMSAFTLRVKRRLLAARVQTS